LRSCLLHGLVCFLFVVFWQLDHNYSTFFALERFIKPNYMKPGINLSILFLVLFLISCGDSTPAEKPQDNANNKKALEEIRKEKKITEAIITDANVLYVSVDDDGTKRDGYAQYLCGILTENAATTKWVKVVKVGSAKEPGADNAFGVLLGESKCE